MLLRHTTISEPRRGVILMVVLALLTLFAIVGLSFVLYAQAEAEASRIYRESRTLRDAREFPDSMFGFALSKLIYDEYDDTTGIYSALRGHSLARSMYGFDNYIDPTTGAMVPNQTAFNGTGRLAVTNNPFTLPETQLVNYTYFPTDPVAAGLLHDPERIGWRALNANPNAVTGGINVPYTYPDLNNMFLGAINANGQVLMPSFHRPWLFGAIDPNSQPLLPNGNPNPNANPNWTNAQGKYMTLRPRPVDMSPAFPYPEDAGGDVKNLYWLPGGNDSLWIDLGYPVQVAPDGRKYKPLFAFFITDLDNRINLNVHGNIRGVGGAHVSNQGWVKSEVNLSKVLLPNALTPTPNAAAPAYEWEQVFAGVVGNNPPPSPGPAASNQVGIRGRYGWPQVGTPPGTFPVPDDPATYTIPGGNYAPSGTSPHLYGEVDFDGCQANFTPTLSILLPGETQGASTWGPYNNFPGFQAGYDNGNKGERTNHPLIYDFFRPFHDPINPAVPTDNRPQIDDRAFPTSEMKELLNVALIVDPSVTQAYGAAPQMAANAMKSQLGLLLPYNFNDPLDIAGSLRRRSLVTTLSMDMSRPGMSPWMWDADPKDANGKPLYGLQVASRGLPGYDAVQSPPPWGNASPFPNPTTLRAGMIPINSEFNIPGATPGVVPSDPTNWRAAMAAVRQILGRLDLSQALPLYPNQLANPTTGVQNVGILRFDDTAPCPNDPQNRSIAAVYAAAQQARVNLATDIYLTLRKLCGAPTVANINAPTDAELLPRRWLAQFAVNIVDFIDSDHISTPFQFYSAITEPGTTVTGAEVDNNLAAPLGNGNPNPELFRYWVFGTELPTIALNEGLGEYIAPAIGTAGPVTINVWAELTNIAPPVPATGLPAGVDQLDSVPTPIYITATNPVPGSMTTSGAYAAYRVVIANRNISTTTDSNGNPVSAGGPLVPRIITAGPPAAYNNDNVLGTPDQVRKQTDDPLDITTVAFSTNTYSTILNPAGNNGTLQPGGAAPLGMPPQSYLFIGPGTNTAPQSFALDHGGPPADPSIPNYVQSLNPANPTIAVPSNAMTYMPTQDTANPPHWTYNGVDVYPDTTAGFTILLRRLANPHMPYNPVPGATFNPYVSADYMEKIPLYNTTTAYYTSTGKLQPLAAHTSQYVPQGPSMNPDPNNKPFTGHTFGRMNGVPDPNNPKGMLFTPPNVPPYDWLVHLDRQLVSPVELLYVSAYHPHELTHRFVLPGPAGSPPSKQNHLAPWFDQTSRLYRFWEFAEVTDRAYGVTSLGRRPGKININTVWDPEILLALFDAPPSPASGNANPTNYFWQDPPNTTNGFYDIYNYANPTASNSIYARLMTGRSSNYFNALTNNTPLAAIGPTDRPFTGTATGNIPVGDALFPNGTGINDTFLRVFDLTQVPPGMADTTGQGRPDLPRMLENPRAIGPAPTYTPDPLLSHPYLRFEPMSKVYDNLTTRSNVFGVWCTVGYFEVTNDQTRPVQLGAEIGKAAGTNVRHRFFSVVDRTQMVIARNLINSAPGAGGQVVNALNPLLGPGQAWVELEMAPGGNAIASVVNGAIVGQQASPVSGRPQILWNINQGAVPGAGTVLVVDRGTTNEEWVQVLAISTTNPFPMMMPAQSSNSPVWILANFIRPHNSGFNITQPGNPGPQPPLDVRNYFHAPVVPVAVTIEPGVVR